MSDKKNTDLTDSEKPAPLSNLDTYLDFLVSQLDAVFPGNPESQSADKHDELGNELRRRFPIKRKHHHVWAHYLRSWSNGRDIHYISKSGKISNDSIAGLAQERDFYKLEKIEPDELALIEAHFTHVHPSLKKAHQKRLDLYKRRYEKLELIRKKGSHIPGVEAFVEWCTYNLIEGENSAIETYARPVLDALVKGNLSILDKRENYVNFTKFLSLQLTRTKALRDKFTRALRADNSPDSLKLANLIEKHWWYLYFMFGDNISTDFIHNSDSYRCTMCTNRTGIEFITSDCPVANIHPQPTVEMINYYPLSPERAFIISNTEEFPVHREINTDEEVDFLNRKIVAAAYENVFASNAEILNRYRPHYLNTRQ